MIELVLHFGARINAKTKDGNTALLEACRAPTDAQDAILLVQILLEHGARANVRNSDNQTPISAACSRSHSALDIVRLLVRHGARVRSMDYLSLWRNQALPTWEKKAVHAAFNEVANEGLRKEEMEWLIMSA
ncbi:uncharacterized protein K452DRAFT_314969 [Neofusicoccum parvum]|uniref:Uncharacterized protein K452DRAFT_314969 n=1 Tax=Neofusicoccum parvum TaxID=310453 RepID=A0ACB5RUJ0_9PEZI|nr:uncharacterized protein K452DRAFT_314969 [Neofusicoccum parvum]GME49704.1 uncharacterized protein K452DRAFT_314969 [Neofusicoccum parvum]